MSDSRRTRIAFYLVVFIILYLYVPSCASGGLSQALGLVQNNYPGFYLPIDINPDSLMQEIQGIAQPMELPDLEEPSADIEDAEILDLDTGMYNQSKRRGRPRRRSRRQEDANYDSSLDQRNSEREVEGEAASTEDDENDAEGRFTPSPTPRVRRDPLGYRLPRPYNYGERNPYRYDDSQIYDPENPYPIPTYPYLEKYYRDLESERESMQDASPE